MAVAYRTEIEMSQDFNQRKFWLNNGVARHAEQDEWDGQLIGVELHPDNLYPFCPDPLLYCWSRTAFMTLVTHRWPRWRDQPGGPHDASQR